MEWFSNPEIWISLATLTLLEIVLGIDNLIFIAILVRRLRETDGGSCRRLTPFFEDQSEVVRRHRVRFAQGQSRRRA